MSVRDLGLVAIGFLFGATAICIAEVAAAREIIATDAFLRQLRLRWNPAVKGQG